MQDTSEDVELLDRNIDVLFSQNQVATEKFKEHDKILAELNSKFDALSKLAVNSAEAIKRWNGWSEAQEAQWNKVFAKLHICPDCGESVSVGVGKNDTWRYECRCGYHSRYYDKPAWKEKPGKDIIPVKEIPAPPVPLTDNKPQEPAETPGEKWWRELNEAVRKENERGK